jgi:hypothetical protein
MCIIEKQKVYDGLLMDQIEKMCPSIKGNVSYRKMFLGLLHTCETTEEELDECIESMNDINKKET